MEGRAGAPATAGPANLATSTNNDASANINPTQSTDSTGDANSGPANPNSASTSKPSAHHHHLTRRRTKTGCLTCRKRRIKCGEERPICRNCVKSKRLCEGYNPRVVWKPPIGDFSGIHGPSQTLQYHSGGLPGSAVAAVGAVIGSNSAEHPSQDAARALDEAAAASHGWKSLRPRLDGLEGWGSYMGHPSQPYGGEPRSAGYVDQPQHIYQHTSLDGQSRGINQSEQHEAYYAQQFTPTSASHNQTVPAPPQEPGYQNAPPNQGPWMQGPPQQHPQYERPLGYLKEGPRVPFAQYDDRRSSFTNEQQSPTTTRTGSFTRNEQALFQKANEILHQDYSYQSVSADTLWSQLQATDPNNTSTILNDAAIEEHDDDYYDVQSEDEMDVLPAAGATINQDLSLMVRLHKQSTSDLTVRGYNIFLYEGMLDTYRASWVATPLKNPQTARVFAHFIHATAPSISVFERSTRNSSALFSEDPVPATQQSLWTYTLPMIALNHQGLLHAMLALASLHIARLQGASTTPSFKHYAYALKRIHHCVGHAQKRHWVSTIAATLLLGYYEVMNADHAKWSSHIVGAKQLISEIDFVDMMEEVKHLREHQQAETKWHHGAITSPGGWQDVPQPSNNDTEAVDERLVSVFFGRKLKYDQFGRVLDEDATAQGKHRPNSKKPKLDISKHQLYLDLLWWYLAQDCYQSIVSGNRPYLDYSRWADYIPRAPLGRPDSLYGTYDHMVLLLGRVAEFSARDRERKIKVVEANGGWRPGPDFPGGPPGGPPRGPSQAPIGRGGPPPGMPGPPGQPPTNPGQAGPPPGMPQPPAFYGMAPIPSATHPPSVYAALSTSPTSSASSVPEPSSPADLAAATAAALAEWSEIRTALNIFTSHLGPRFRPLDASLHYPSPSPFGPTTHYRSYDIALIWATVHEATILLWRAHPSMPPAAMMAAGVAAGLTASAADAIGAIVAGIPLSDPLNPSLGGVVTGLALPVFFAGVQFQAADKRAWVQSYLRTVEARTGWATASLIALGCETAWENAYLAGRGPPYTKRRIKESEDDRLAGRRDGKGDGLAGFEERRYIHVNQGTRAHWAMGLLALEEDLKVVGLEG